MFCLFIYFLLICFIFVSLFCLVSFFPSFLLAKDLAFVGNNCETKCCSQSNRLGIQGNRYRIILCRGRKSHLYS